MNHPQLGCHSPHTPPHHAVLGQLLHGGQHQLVTQPAVERFAVGLPLQGWRLPTRRSEGSQVGMCGEGTLSRAHKERRCMPFPGQCPSDQQRKVHRHAVGVGAALGSHVQVGGAQPLHGLEGARKACSRCRKGAVVGAAEQPTCTL